MWIISSDLGKCLFRVTCFCLVMSFLAAYIGGIQGDSSARQRITGPNVCGSRRKNCCSGWGLSPSRSTCTAPKCDNKCGRGGLCVAPRKCRCSDGSVRPRCDNSASPTQTDDQQQGRLFAGRCSQARGICQHFCLSKARNVFQCACQPGYRLLSNNRSCGRDMGPTWAPRPVPTGQTRPATTSRYMSTHRGRRSILDNAHTKRLHDELQKLFMNQTSGQESKKYENKNDSPISAYYNSLYQRAIKSKFMDGRRSDIFRKFKEGNKQSPNSTKGNAPGNLFNFLNTYKNKQGKLATPITREVVGNPLCSDCTDSQGLYDKNKATNEEIKKVDDIKPTQPSTTNKMYDNNKYFTAYSGSQEMGKFDTVKTKQQDSFQELQKSNKLSNTFKESNRMQQETPEYLKRANSEDPFQEINPTVKYMASDKQKLPLSLTGDIMFDYVTPSVKVTTPNVDSTKKRVTFSGVNEERKKLPVLKEAAERKYLKYLDLEKDIYINKVDKSDHEAITNLYNRGRNHVSDFAERSNNPPSYLCSNCTDKKGLLGENTDTNQEMMQGNDKKNTKHSFLDKLYVDNPLVSGSSFSQEKKNTENAKQEVAFYKYFSKDLQKTDSNAQVKENEKKTKVSSKLLDTKQVNVLRDNSSPSSKLYNLFNTDKVNKTGDSRYMMKNTNKQDKTLGLYALDFAKTNEKEKTSGLYDPDFAKTNKQDKTLGPYAPDFAKTNKQDKTLGPYVPDFAKTNKQDKTLGPYVPDFAKTNKQDKTLGPYVPDFAKTNKQDKTLGPYVPDFAKTNKQDKTLGLYALDFAKTNKQDKTLGLYALDFAKTNKQDKTLGLYALDFAKTNKQDKTLGLYALDFAKTNEKDKTLKQYAGDFVKTNKKDKTLGTYAPDFAKSNFKEYLKTPAVLLQPGKDTSQGSVEPRKIMQLELTASYQHKQAGKETKMAAIKESRFDSAKYAGLTQQQNEQEQQPPADIPVVVSEVKTGNINSKIGSIHQFQNSEKTLPFIQPKKQVGLKSNKEDMLGKTFERNVKSKQNEFLKSDHVGGILSADEKKKVENKSLADVLMRSLNRQQEK